MASPSSRDYGPRVQNGSRRALSSTERRVPRSANAEFLIRGPADHSEIQLLDIHKAHDDVRDLHAGVVDIILHFDAIPCGLKNANKRISEHGIAHVTDMRRLVGIDAGVFDH